MSEETEMDLDDAISADMDNIATAMRNNTPLELAETAWDATDKKVCSIRDQVLAGRAITAKQLWVLANYAVNGEDSLSAEVVDDWTIQYG